jgi:hypothetical protein
MSKILPLFAAAPRLVIKVNGQKIAYAVGLNMSVSVDIVPVKILGQYEIASLEPAAYNPVTGTFRVIRLLKSSTQKNITDAAKTSESSLVSNPDKIAPAITSSDDNTSVLSQSFLHRHLDPRKVLISQTFDIELYLKIPQMTMGSGVNANMVDAYTGDLEEPFLRLQDCRIVGMDGEIAPGRLLEEPLSFQGLLAVNSSMSVKESLDSALIDGRRV